MPAPGWSPGVPRLIMGPRHGRAPARWRTQSGAGELGRERAGKLGQAAGHALDRQNSGKKILANIQNIF
jgi:hypothetical protein